MWGRGVEGVSCEAEGKERGERWGLRGCMRKERGVSCVLG